MRRENEKGENSSNNDFDLTRFFVTLLAGSPDARMAPTARLDYNGARAKLAGQINVMTTLRIESIENKEKGILGLKWSQKSCSKKTALRCAQKKAARSAVRADLNPPGMIIASRVEWIEAAQIRPRK